MTPSKRGSGATQRLRGEAIRRLRWIVLSVVACVALPTHAAAGFPAGAPATTCVASHSNANAGPQDRTCYETVVASDHPDETPLPLVVGLHWSGSTPAEFREVLAGIRTPVRLLLVQGRHARRAGFSFYPTDPYYYDLDAGRQRDIQLAESSRIAALIEMTSRRFPTCGTAIVVGASQGGDLSYLVGLRHPDVVGLAVPLMATMDRGLIPRHAPRRVPIHPMHGVDDAIVPIDTARALAEAASAQGFDVSLTEFAGIGHDVPPAMRSKVAGVIDAYLRQVDCDR